MWGPPNTNNNYNAAPQQQGGMPGGFGHQQQQPQWNQPQQQRQPQQWNGNPQQQRQPQQWNGNLQQQQPGRFPQQQAQHQGPGGWQAAPQRNPAFPQQQNPAFPQQQNNWPAQQGGKWPQQQQQPTTNYQQAGSGWPGRQPQQQQPAAPQPAAGKWPQQQGTMPGYNPAPMTSGNNGGFKPNTNTGGFKPFTPQQQQSTGQNSAAQNQPLKPATCPKGHTLTRSKYQNWNCDDCKLNHQQGTTWACRQCDFDLCEACHRRHAAKQQQQPSQQQQKPQGPRRCPRGHTLSYMKYQYWNCDDCKLNHQEGMTWACRQCDFDLCNTCYRKTGGGSNSPPPSIKPQAHHSAPPTTRAKCPQGHPLLAGTLPDWNCDKCRRRFQNTGATNFGCRACDYDMCGDCARQQEEIDDLPGLDALAQAIHNQNNNNNASPQSNSNSELLPITDAKCPSGHKLSASRLPDWNCDQCRGRFNNSKISFGCRQCDFDICQTCEQKNSSSSCNHHTFGGGFGQGFASGGASSNATKPPQTLQQAQQASTGKFRSLFIGINYPGTSAALSGCVNDVKVIRDLLGAHKFPLDDSRILVDDRRFPGRYGEPDKRTILQSLKWLVDDAKPGDTLFLHYSGHGGQMRDQDGDEDDGMDETLIPADYQHHGQIRDDDIFKIVCSKLPPGVRLTAVMDCCHSGTLMDLPYHWVPSTGSRPGQKKLPQRRGGAKTRDFVVDSRNKCEADAIMFSGCKDTQTSADVGNTSTFHHDLGPGKAGGACTNALAEVLMDKRCHDLSFTELLAKMQTNLKRRRFSQVPQLSCSKPFDENMTFSFFGLLQHDML